MERELSMCVSPWADGVRLRSWDPVAGPARDAHPGAGRLSDSRATKSSGFSYRKPEGRAEESSGPARLGLLDLQLRKHPALFLQAFNWRNRVGKVFYDTHYELSDCRFVVEFFQCAIKRDFLFCSPHSIRIDLPSHSSRRKFEVGRNSSQMKLLPSFFIAQFSKSQIKEFINN